MPFQGLFALQPVHLSPLTIDHTQVPSTQTDFPVLVSFTDNRFKTTANGGHVSNNNGFDIAFYSDLGGTTKLKWELERYNSGTGEIVFWVKIPSVSSASDTVFYVFYGDTSIHSDQSDPTNVWTNSFVCVYHLKDGSTLNVLDSLNAHNGTNHGATATAGQIDGGAAFASASSQYIDCGVTVPGVQAATTISAWVNGTSFPNTYNTIAGWDANGPTRQAMIWVKSTGKMTFFVFTLTTGSVGYDGTGSHTLSAGTSYLIHMTYSSAAGLVGYVNGASDGTGAGSGALQVAGGAPFYISNDAVTAGRFWNGWMDEVRNASVARSADWITCEYNNQQAASTFVTLGAEQ